MCHYVEGGKGEEEGWGGGGGFSGYLDLLPSSSLNGFSSVRVNS